MVVGAGVARPTTVAPLERAVGEGGRAREGQGGRCGMRRHGALVGPRREAGRRRWEELARRPA